MNNRKVITIDLKDKKIPFRTIFWGYHSTGWNTYSYLKESPLFELIAVVLPSNRDHETITRLREDAKLLGLKIFEPVKLKEKIFIDKIKDLSPNLYMVDSYSKLIPHEILSLTSNLGFNLHPGLLPQYRGAHVLNWVIINGESRTGMTLHLLSDSFDEGPIVADEIIDIGLLDTVNDIDEKLNQKIPLLLGQLEKQIRAKIIIARIQEGDMQHYRARKPHDGEIQVEEDINVIYNKIRALTYPWPGAYLVKDKAKIIIWQAYPSNLSVDLSPGEFLRKNDDIFLISGDKKLLLLKCINDPSKENYTPIEGIDIIKILERYKINIIPHGFI